MSYIKTRQKEPSKRHKILALNIYSQPVTHTQPTMEEEIDCDHSSDVRSSIGDTMGNNT